MAKKAKRLFIANWKMYIESPKEAVDFARKLRRRGSLPPGLDVGIASASVLLPAVAQALKRSSVMLGAQSISPFEGGAHTGEISATMAKEAGAAFVLVGHSERRAAGETDEAIAAMLERAAQAKLRAVLCIGEHARDESGAHFEFLAEQLKRALARFPKDAAQKLLAVAYEPVWAIGKSAKDAMKPEELRETAIFIRKKLADLLGRERAMKVPVLYGGSVEEENARALIEGGSVAGFLIGHASAELGSFLAILRACAK